MDGFMEITVSTGTLHHRYGAGEGMQTGYRLSPGTAGDTQRRGVSHTRSIPRNFIQTPAYHGSQCLPERLPGVKILWNFRHPTGGSGKIPDLSAANHDTTLWRNRNIHYTLLFTNPL